MKKTLALLLSLTYLNAALPEENSNIKKTFDGTNGWWWYEEEVKDPKTDKKETIKYTLTPAEKLKIESEEKTQKLLQQLIVIQTENKKLNEEIKDRLIYAFPRTTPKYTINKKTGEQCLTNSSKDCFVMPVIQEGQNVPALMSFLRNPSPENSKNWLQWQATYFNHVNKVSNGLRFAYLKDGEEAYPTMTDYTYGDDLFYSQSENMRANKENDIMKSMKDELAYLVFIGESKMMDKVTSVFDDITSLNRGTMKDFKKVLIFPSKEVLEEMNNYVVNYLHKDRKRQTEFDAWNEMKKVIRPDLYEKHKIRVTPTVIAYYKDKNMKKELYQTIKIGGADFNSLRDSTINFLQYNGIIEPKERSADRNWNVLETDNLNKELNEISKPKMPTDFNKTEEEVKKYEKDN